MARQKAQAAERITADEGNILRRNRSIQVEGAFGIVKQDRDFRRFLTPEVRQRLKHSFF